jgi:hypothetical protein
MSFLQSLMRELAIVAAFIGFLLTLSLSFTLFVLDMSPKLRSILTGIGGVVTLAATFRVLPQNIADAIVSESPKILPAVLILWSAVAGKRHVDEK